jgi:hypothetical protein
MKISQVLNQLDELRFTNIAKPTASTSAPIPKKGQITPLGTVGAKRAAAQQATNVKTAYQQSIAPQAIPQAQPVPTGSAAKPSSTTPTQPGTGTTKAAPTIPQATPGIGTKIGQGVGAVAKGVGAVAGGVVGAGQAFGQGFNQGRATVAGQAPQTNQPAQQQAPKAAAKPAISPEVHDEIAALKASLSNLERTIGR